MGNGSEEHSGVEFLAARQAKPAYADSRSYCSLGVKEIPGFASGCRGGPIPVQASSLDAIAFENITHTIPKESELAVSGKAQSFEPLPPFSKKGRSRSQERGGSEARFTRVLTVLSDGRKAGSEPTTNSLGCRSTIELYPIGCEGRTFAGIRFFREAAPTRHWEPRV
jgi:hypothetical protein